MFILVIVFIAILSVVLSFLSLRHLNDKKEIRKTSRELLKNRIVYRKDHDSSSSSS